MHCEMKEGLFSRTPVLRIACVSIGFVAMFWLAGIPFTQVDCSALSGTVTDPAGLVISGIRIGRLPVPHLSLAD